MPSARKCRRACSVARLTPASTAGHVGSRAPVPPARSHPARALSSHPHAPVPPSRCAERPLLLTSFAVSKLMPVAAALAHTLSPLSFSGTFIPFLPAALHPDPNTLVNCSPTPFIIGVERNTLPALQPIAPRPAPELEPTTMPRPGHLARPRPSRAAPRLELWTHGAHNDMHLPLTQNPRSSLA